MKSTYRVLAYLIALEVVVQASMIAWAMYGFSKWIDEGGVFNKAKLEGDSWSFFEERGFMVHGINGSLLVPLLALILLIISFFAKVPGGVKYAAVLVVLIILQAFVLPELGHEMPFFGALHGMNALVILAVAVMAGKRVTAVTSEEARAPVSV